MDYPNAREYHLPEEFNEYTAVKVTNLGDKEFRGGHAGKTHALAPGESRFLPWDAARRWCGDPFAVNVGQDKSTHWRSGEVDRLSTLYGIYSNPWTSDEPFEVIDEFGPSSLKPHVYVEREDGKFYHPYLPNLRVETADGQVLKTVIDDPEGDDITPAQQSTVTEAKAMSALREELERKLRQVDLIMAQQAKVPANPEFEGDTGNVTDQPSVTPEPRTPGPTVGDPRANGPRRGRPPKSA